MNLLNKNRMEKDFNYEKYNRIAYKGYQKKAELGIKCKNYDLCEGILPKDHFKRHKNYLCLYCGEWFLMKGFGWNELEFFENNENCIVCFTNHKKKVKFPTNCGHSFCIDCSREILFFDEKKYHLSPMPYGCPPCPNGCKNPEKGRQCYCEEYDKIIDQWKDFSPVNFDEWIYNERLSIDKEEDNEGSIYGSAKCPICRKTYHKEGIH